MKTLTRFLSILFVLLSGLLSAQAEIHLDGRDSPPEIVERAKNLAAQKNYAAILQMIPEIDARFKGVHNLEYFKSLAGLLGGIYQAYGEGTVDFDYHYAWTVRKIAWKFLLTPHSDPKDAFEILTTEQTLVGAGFACASGPMLSDRDQFAALRRDAVALLKAYAASIRAQIIPSYQRKAQRRDTRTLMSAVPIPPPTPEEIAQEKKLDEVLARNASQNHEQDQLNECLYQLHHAATVLAESDFGCQPVDDETLADLLETFPPLQKSKEEILSWISSARLRDLAGIERRRKAKATPTPPKPQK